VPIPISVLTPLLLEEIKTRVLFCSVSSGSNTNPSYPLQSQPTSISSTPQQQRRHDALNKDERIESDQTTSHATDIHFPIQLPTTQEKATLMIPGWIREHAMDILFEGNDESDYAYKDIDIGDHDHSDDDTNKPPAATATAAATTTTGIQQDYEFETGIAHCILNCLRKVPADLRKPLISSLLVVGGTALVPGFQKKLKHTLLMILHSPTPLEKARYASLAGLAPFIQFLDQHTLDDQHQQKSGPIFKSNVRGWIGGKSTCYLKGINPFHRYLTFFFRLSHGIIEALRGRNGQRKV
jgi:actin-related protein 10